MKREWALVRMFAFLLLAASLFAPACKGKGASTSETGASGASDAKLPVVSDSSEGLLFTWIDEKGEFHIQEKTADVPVVARDAVRVVDPTNYDGNHPELIFVADLRTPGPDGSYAVKQSTRADFDALAEVRRAKNGQTLANSGNKPGQEPPASGSASAGPGQGPPGAAHPSVIVYGASWCGACHQAAAYLKKKGVPFVEKDIEEDANAAREMQSKLARAGKRSGSIPVLDVRGKVMVGFNPQEVDNALGEAL